MWTLTEPEPDDPRTPERAEILALLAQRLSHLPGRQRPIAGLEQRSPISMLLIGMVRAGDLTLARYGKYIPTDSADSTDSSSLREPMKKNYPLFDGREDGTESAESVESVPVPESEATPSVAELAAPDSEASPPADFPLFAWMVADQTRSRLDESSIRRVPDAPEQRRLDDFMMAEQPLLAAPPGWRRDAGRLEACATSRNALLLWALAASAVEAPALPQPDQRGERTPSRRGDRRRRQPGERRTRDDEGIARLQPEPGRKRARREVVPGNGTSGYHARRPFLAVGLPRNDIDHTRNPGGSRPQRFADMVDGGAMVQ